MILDTDILVDVLRKYPPAIAWFATLNPLPPVSGIAALELVYGVRGMIELKAVEYQGTPSDNNAAERAIRPAVIARKISGGTRSDKGSDSMSALYSLFGTWKVRGHDALACCHKLLCGTMDSTENPS